MSLAPSTAGTPQGNALPLRESPDQCALMGSLGSIRGRNAVGLELLALCASGNHEMAAQTK